LLTTEKVKTFYQSYNSAELTVQHEETPQPPPEKPREGTDEEISPPEAEEQQNADITFFTLFVAHFGHFVSCSEALTA
jgi:hypothetical protein